MINKEKWERVLINVVTPKIYIFLVTLVQHLLYC